MSRTELKSFVDRCTRADQRYLIAYLRTKDPQFQRKLAESDREVNAGRTIRLRATQRGLVRIAA